MAAIAKPNCMNQNSLLETVKPKPKSLVVIPVSNANQPLEFP